MVYDDPAWQDYIQKLGDRLVSYSPEPNRKFHFTVIDGEDVNAFSLGDEYIFVYRGLIAYMESEDELAGVVGHEIGHVVLHHMSKIEFDGDGGKSRWVYRRRRNRAGSGHGCDESIHRRKGDGVWAGA